MKRKKAWRKFAGLVIYGRRGAPDDEIFFRRRMVFVRGARRGS
jgi:hypothetical protein